MKMPPDKNYLNPALQGDSNMKFRRDYLQVILLNNLI
jgi:hypothetical protein